MIGGSWWGGLAPAPVGSADVQHDVDVLAALTLGGAGLAVGVVPRGLDGGHLAHLAGVGRDRPRPGGGEPRVVGQDDGGLGGVAALAADVVLVHGGHGFILLYDGRRWWRWGGLAAAPPRSSPLGDVRVNRAGDESGQPAAQALDLEADFHFVAVLVDVLQHAVDLHVPQGAYPDGAQELGDALLKGARPRAGAGARVEREVAVGVLVPVGPDDGRAVAERLADSGLGHLGHLENAVADLEKAAVNGAVVLDDLQQALALDDGKRELPAVLRAVVASDGAGKDVLVAVVGHGDVLDGAEFRRLEDDGVVLLHGNSLSFVGCGGMGWSVLLSAVVIVWAFPRQFSRADKSTRLYILWDPNTRELLSFQGSLDLVPI